MIKIYCDSSTRELCYIIEDEEPVVIEYPYAVTNNVGEYRAVIQALKAAPNYKLDIQVITDSLLVVNQVSGIWKRRKAELIPLCDIIQRVLVVCPYITLSWIPREINLAGKVLEHVAMLRKKNTEASRAELQAIYQKT